MKRYFRLVRYTAGKAVLAVVASTNFVTIVLTARKEYFTEMF